MLWCHVSQTAMTFEIGYGEGGEEAPVSLEAEERKYERQWLCGFLAVAGEGRGAVYGNVRRERKTLGLLVPQGMTCGLKTLARSRGKKTRQFEQQWELSFIMNTNFHDRLITAVKSFCVIMF